MGNIGFRLPAYFQDHMILQQGVTNRIFGQSKKNAQLQIDIERFPAIQKNKAGKKPESARTVQYGTVYQHSVTTDQRGFFDFKIPPFEPSKDFYKITLTVANIKCELKNIYFGEVWLALGESNMSMPCKYTDVQQHLAKLNNNPYLRFFSMAENGLAKGEENYLYHPTAKIPDGKWLKASLENMQNISAIALTFAAKLQSVLQIPVGIYNLAARDTMLHSWLPREMIEQDEQIKDHIIKIGHYRDLSNWNDLQSAKQEQTAERLTESAERLTFSKKNQPAAMYNHKLAPFTGLSMRGIILAHGESDVFYPKYYLKAFKYFMESVEQLFHSFKRGPYLIFSQLAPYFYDAHDDKTLAYFNEALTIARRQIPLRAGLVTVYDLPLDYDQTGKHGYARPLNPIAKYKLAERMFQIAQGLVYQAVAPKSAPEVKYAEWVSDKLLLSFTNVGKGLTLPENDLSLKGFNICNKNSRYIDAQANKLFGVRTLVWHPEIKEPTSCSYGFSTFNQYANLKSENGMPVVPFRLSPDQPDNALRHDFMLCDRLEGWTVPTEKPYCADMPAKEKPGYHPLWQISQGKAKLILEMENKRTSMAAFNVRFEQADRQDIIFEPVLHYASLYPPLDFSFWHFLQIDLFNADHVEKQIALRIIDHSDQMDQTQFYQIKDLLAWQTIRFDLQKMAVDLSKIINLQFILKSAQPSGEMTVNSLQCTGLINE